VVIHFIAIVSTFRCWFRRIGMIPCGWQTGFLHSPAVAQITRSSVKLRLSVSVVNCCRALWSGLSVRPSRNVFYDFEHGSCLIEFSCFLFFFGGGGIFYLLELHKILDPNRSFTSKMDISMFLIRMSVSEIRTATQFGTHRQRISCQRCRTVQFLGTHTACPGSPLAR